MRQRVTFVHRPENAVDPASLAVSHDAIRGPDDVEAVREDRITLALDELPPNTQTLLKDAHELHIKWTSPVARESISPFLARQSPGLHVFYTPARDVSPKKPQLCVFLTTVFTDVDCISAAKSFTALPGDRFSHSTTFQYYQPLLDVSKAVNYASYKICQYATSRDECKSWVASLADASSIDISYDAISHAIKLTALWPHQSQPLHVGALAHQRTEVGILMADSPANIEPHELGLTGLLTVLGQDEKPSPTMFTFPSRHRHAGSTFSAGFDQSTGLHPTLGLTLSSGRPPVPDASCAPHAYLTLPRTIFADRYQLADPLFLASHNLTALRHISQPVDLEAPDYAMTIWGSTALLELSPPESTGGDDAPWTARVPLHLRYLDPQKGGYSNIDVPYPVVFWACTAEEGTKFSNNPFERVNLGYDGLFGPRTVFWHVDPQPEVGSNLLVGERLVNRIKVPVLDLDKSGWVSAGTAVAILLGFLYVVWNLASAHLNSGYQSSRRKTSGTDKKTQ